MASDLYIICAGVGSRFGLRLPKALVTLKDEPCLTANLRQVASKFKHVFIVTNKVMSDVWEQYEEDLRNVDPDLLKNVIFVPIHSGLGDGHAVKVALAEAGRITAGSNKQTSHDIVIMWGDVIIKHHELMDELLSRQMNVGIMPAIRKDNPYVTLLVDLEMQCISADFSKYGEAHKTGFHDQSVFRFNKGILKDVLYYLHNSFWKNGRYITQGGELSLLYTFHYLYNIGKPVEVYETAYSTASFNTMDELILIRKEIKC